MEPHERLKMLFLSDMQSRNVDTHLSHQNEAERARPKKPPAPPITEQGVSESIPEFDFDPDAPVRIPINNQFHLSYIRTHVIGILNEDDSYLTELDQDFSSASCTPELSPRPSTISNGRRLDNSLGHVPDKRGNTLIPNVPNPTSFTPVVTMARYAIKYCSGDMSKTVSRRFYKGGKFWKRTWDLYFLPVPSSVYDKPFLLIPTVQAQALLDEINSATNFRLTLTGPGKQGLVLEFTNELPRPRFIGRSETAEQKDKLVAALPSSADSWGHWSEQVEPGVFWAYEEKIRKSVATMNIDKDAEKEARKVKREATIKKLEQCLGRVQAYFGLRPALVHGVVQPSFANGKLKPIDVLSPAQFRFQDMPIFISLDTEWMEGYGILTEVGISTLDTWKLQGVVPGDFGHMWLSQIRSRHLRVVEHRRHVNKRYQQGCPGKFHHGRSEFVSARDIATIVDNAFSPPPIVVSGHEQKRTVILVGLNLAHDIDLLKEKKSEVFLNLDMTLPTPCSSIIHEVIDVAQLYRVYAGEPQPPGLANLLKYLQIVGQDLHNAGNDAYHTLEALVRLMLQAAGEKPGAYEPAARLASFAAAAAAAAAEAALESTEDLICL